MKAVKSTGSITWGCDGMIKVVHTFKEILLNRWFIAGAGLAAWAVVAVLVVSASVIGNYNRYILKDDSAKQSHEMPVGLVLGAGITGDGKPFRELQSRLDTAAAAMKAGQVGKLIVSGDNRFEKYDEPTAMKNYLVNVKGIDPDKIQPDFAGRSTYESCERASKIFKLDKTIIFSAGSHLPRAIF